MFDTATWMIWKKFRWKCAAVNVLKTSTLILLGFGVFPFLILLTRIVYLIFILSKGETSSIAGDSPSFRHFAIYTAVMSVLGIRESSKSHITLLPCCHSFLLSHCSSVLQLQPPAQAFYYEVCKPCSMDRGCFQRRRIVISYFAWLSRSLFCTFAGGPDMWPFFFLLIREPVPSGMPFFVAYILFLSKVKNSVHVTDFTCVLFVLIVWLQASMTQCCRMDYCERDRSDLDVQAFLEFLLAVPGNTESSPDYISHFYIVLRKLRLVLLILRFHVYLYCAYIWHCDHRSSISSQQTIPWLISELFMIPTPVMTPECKRKIEAIFKSVPFHCIICRFLFSVIHGGS